MGPKAPRARAHRILAVLALAALLPLRSADDPRRKQEIVFPEVPAHALGDAPFEIQVKSTSGLPVSLELIAGPAAIDGRKVTLGDAPGLVIVRATQAGNPLFAPAAPTERAFAVNPRPAPPGFTRQPQGGAVEVGDTIVLTAGVSGEPKPDLQWRRDKGPVAGATGAALTIMTAALPDSGSYDVVATNASGSETSAPARVTVSKRRQSISFEGAASAAAGQPLQLSATATSGLPVRFELVSGMATLIGSTLTAQAGEVTVRATQEGNADYGAAQPALRTILVRAGP